MCIRDSHIGSFAPLSSASAHRLALAMSLSEERKFILEVIEVYWSLPPLWNVKSKDYSNRTKNEQYDEILKKYNEKCPNADKKELIKKISQTNCSFQTNFRKNLK